MRWHRRTLAGLILAAGGCVVNGDPDCLGEGCGASTVGPDGTRVYTCPEGGCYQECDGPQCDIACEGGGCEVNCAGDACLVDCAGGSCQVTCTADVCTVGCAGDGCQVQCTGAEHCAIDDCGDSCMLDCGGAPTCENACTPLAGCVTVQG